MVTEAISSQNRTLVFFDAEVNGASKPSFGLLLNHRHVDPFHSPQELSEENRILSRELRRREIELDRLTDTTGDLPTILRAHNEEVRALKHKLKQVSRVKS